MSYASILVAVDLGPAAADRIKLAAAFANRCEATLIGAAARKVPDVLLVSDIYDAQLQYEHGEGA